MKYYATFDADGLLTSRLIGGVHEIPDDAVDVNDDLWMRMTQEQDGQWSLVEGVIVKVAIAQTPLTKDQVVATLRSQVQQMLDSSAAAAGYDDIKNAISYADEPAVQKFQSEGIAFRSWRSLVWESFYTQTAGDELPSTLTLLDALPKLALP